jgi:hypothetical protein
MGPGELGLTVFVTFESFGLDSIEWYESDWDFIVLTYQILDLKKVWVSDFVKFPYMKNVYYIHVLIALCDLFR